MPNKLPWRLLLILWVAAALLYCIGLGNAPLRDFDEATVARVALELHQGAGGLREGEVRGEGREVRGARWEVTR